MAQLDESTIRSLCRELLMQPGKPSGRSLRRELQARYQMSGKTQRVFAIWREEQQAVIEAEWRRRLSDAESDVQRLRDQVAQLMSEVTMLRSRSTD
jgi:hypothetical protein